MADAPTLAATVGRRGGAAEITLITMLGAALTVTIGMLGAALFSALSRIDGLQRDIGLMRAELIESTASLRAEIQDLSARPEEHMRQHVA